MKEQVLGVSFALMGTFGWGLGNAMIQVPAQRIGPLRTLFYRNLFISAATLLIFLFVLEDARPSLDQTLLVILLSALGYVSLLAMYRAKKTGKVGVISPICNSSVVVTIALAVFVLGERFAPGQYVALAAIVAGIVLSSVNLKDLKGSDLLSANSGVPFALITALAWGVMFAFLKFPAQALGAVLAALILNLSNLAMSALHLKAAGVTFQPPDRRTLLYTLAMGVCGALAIIGFNESIRHIDVGIATAIAFAGPFVTILYGILVYGERYRPQQYFGMACMVGGIVMTYLLI